MYNDLHKMVQIIKDGSLIKAVEGVIGELE